MSVTQGGPLGSCYKCHRAVFGQTRLPLVAKVFESRLVVQNLEGVGTRHRFRLTHAFGSADTFPYLYFM